ncbi:MAG: endonuclease/exonuclease/phosphatase family protein [Bacteroidales bacterium]|nr:endonuclease/exonuclease/phosphatase family protein [Bacteroidales bacterium]
MNLKRIILSSLITTLFVGLVFKSNAQESESKYRIACVGFYNLENLFDTIDDPNVEDEEFLPDGESNWNTQRYNAKLNNMSKVISMLGTEITPDGAAVLGVSEIENRRVLEDLVNMPKLQDRNYKIIHHNSPGDRGIDVALLYQPKYLEVENVNNHLVSIEDKPDFKTRDQMVVSGNFDGEKMHFIVNHWPSRYGGEKRSKPLRAAAAKVGRAIIDSLMQIDPQAKIVYLGDLNDDPVDKSVSEILNSVGEKDKLTDKTLYNPMVKLFRKGIGSNAYRDLWNLFDQVLVSPALVGKDYSSYKFYRARVFNEKFLMQDSGRYEGYPYRTFAGGSYLGGYSDHFPVYIYLVKEIQ